MITGPLFPLLVTCPKKYLVCQGGGDAGKTVSILQYLGREAVANPGSVITITGQDVPNLKKGALRSFQKYVEKDIEQYLKSFNTTERIYITTGGSILEFLSFKDEQDARGSERDYLYMNEANSETYSMFWQLQRKTRKKVILDYNPTAPFWVHDKVLPGVNQEKQFRDKVQLYITDHRHNPFLTQDEHDAYESIGDPDLFDVYARGKTGKVKGLIYGHFRKVDRIPNDCERIIWGIDYGYTNDPTAIVKVGVKGRKRYVKLCSYRPGITEEEILNILKANGHQDDELVYSEHDTEMVFKLRQLGLPIYPARKGPGSKWAMISTVRKMECYYTEDSVKDDDGKSYFEEELKVYKFVKAQDVITGKEVLTNQPIDAHDHGCDATGYAIHSDCYTNGIAA